MNKAVIASCNFSVGHTTHMVAFYKMFIEMGYNTSFVCNEEYTNFSNVIKKNRISYWSFFRNNEDGDIFVAVAPSIRVLFKCFFLRLFTKVSVNYILHEPYSSFSSYLKAGFNFLQVVRIFVISIFNNITCILSHNVLLPSKKAFDTFNKSRLKYLRNFQINLIFYDQASIKFSQQDKKYFSYIGTIAEDHAFEEFIRIVNNFHKDQSILKDAKFLIATKSKIPKRLQKLVKSCEKRGILDVFSGNVMTNNEINSYYQQSLVVWSAYKRSMQSGVLPMSYMFGCPVIVMEDCIPDSFLNGSTGLVISSNYCPNEFKVCLDKIISTYSTFSDHSREYYLKNFDYNSMKDIYLKILNDEQKN